MIDADFLADSKKKIDAAKIIYEKEKKFEQAVERGLPGYCDKCREQEINLYETVLSWDECEELNIDYYDAHTNACKITNCNHQFWYSPDDPKLNDDNKE